MNAYPECLGTYGVHGMSCSRAETPEARLDEEARARIRVLERDMAPMIEKLRLDDLALPNYQRAIAEHDALRAEVEKEPKP